MNLGLNKVVTVNSDIHKNKTFFSKRSGQQDTMSVPQEQESYIIFFKSNFLGFFVHLSFIAPDLEIFFFHFRALNLSLKRPYLFQKQEKRKKRKQKGNVRNKMSLKRTQCMPL